jgi:hypothetical protein
MALKDDTTKMKKFLNPPRAFMDDYDSNAMHQILTLTAALSSPDTIIENFREVFSDGKSVNRTRSAAISRGGGKKTLKQKRRGILEFRRQKAGGPEEREEITKKVTEVSRIITEEKRKNPRNDELILKKLEELKKLYEERLATYKENEKPKRFIDLIEKVNTEITDLKLKSPKSTTRALALISAKKPGSLSSSVIPRSAGQRSAIGVKVAGQIIPVSSEAEREIARRRQESANSLALSLVQEEGQIVAHISDPGLMEAIRALLNNLKASSRDDLANTVKYFAALHTGSNVGDIEFSEYGRETIRVVTAIVDSSPIIVDFKEEHISPMNELLKTLAKCLFIGAAVPVGTFYAAKNFGGLATQIRGSLKDVPYVGEQTDTLGWWGGKAVGYSINVVGGGILKFVVGAALATVGGDWVIDETSRMFYNALALGILLYTMIFIWYTANASHKSYKIAKGIEGKRKRVMNKILQLASRTAANILTVTHEQYINDLIAIANSGSTPELRAYIAQLRETALARSESDRLTNADILGAVIPHFEARAVLGTKAFAKDSLEDLIRRAPLGEQKALVEEFNDVATKTKQAEEQLIVIRHAVEADAKRVLAAASGGIGYAYGATTSFAGSAARGLVSLGPTLALGPAGAAASLARSYLQGPGGPPLNQQQTATVAQNVVGATLSTIHETATLELLDEGAGL